MRKTPEALTRAEQFDTAALWSKSDWTKACDFALSKVRGNIARFGPGQYPPPASIHNVYPAIDNTQWTSGFWTALLWLSYELTGEKTFSGAATSHLDDYRKRLDERIRISHDLGFLYTLSSVSAWHYTKNESARHYALKAADLLIARFLPKPGVIQAWGELKDPVQDGRIIIDTALNLPLLLWASEQTGNPYCRDVAASHIRQANRYLIRDDDSTFHTYYFSSATGEALRGSTHQGFSDTSCWARGQSWGILGNALIYRYLKDPALLETSRHLAHYFLNRLPDDLVAYWDLVFVDGPEERDSSASAISACGLLELATHLPLLDPERQRYQNAALHIVKNLSERYTSAGIGESNGILLHGVYGKPNGNGIDECTIWGDYFYLEALVRIGTAWSPFW